VLFPAWLEHRVEASKNDQERISVSFNLSLPRELVEQIHESTESFMSNELLPSHPAKGDST
jgi:hypothetical protein